MDANQVKTKAEKVREWLRKCWTTRGLLVIGCLACAIAIVLLVSARDLEQPGMSLTVALLVIIFCTGVCIARLAVKAAVSMFVSFPHKIFRICVPNSFLKNVPHVRVADILLMLTGVLFIANSALVYIRTTPFDRIFVLITLTWFVCAIWYRLSVLWRKRLEILIFGDQDKPIGVSVVILFMLLMFILNSALDPMLKILIFKAQYAADGVPAIGHIRTLATIHHGKHGVLPGVQSWEINGVAEYADTSQSGVVLTAPNPGDYTNIVQTFLDFTNKAYCADGDASAPIVITNSTILAAHYANQLLLPSTDLMGRHAKPDHFQYMVMDSGFGRTSYAYAVGVLANGDWLKAGTGYAVVEIVNPGNPVNPKIVAAWQRFKAKPSQGPICLAVKKSAELRAIGGKEQVERVLPVAAELIYPNMPTAEQSAEALAAMRQIGWEL